MRFRNPDSEKRIIIGMFLCSFVLLISAIKDIQSVILLSLGLGWIVCGFNFVSISREYRDRYGENFKLCSNWMPPQLHTLKLLAASLARAGRLKNIPGMAFFGVFLVVSLSVAGFLWHWSQAQ